MTTSWQKEKANRRARAAAVALAVSATLAMMSTAPLLMVVGIVLQAVVLAIAVGAINDAVVRCPVCDTQFKAGAK